MCSKYFKGDNMKTFKQISVFLVFIFAMNCFSQTTTTTKKEVRKQFPHVTISPFGGAIFPLPKILNQNFKPGGHAGLEIGYRFNREVAMFGEFNYYFMASKITGAPIGSYFQFSAGPRYHFVHPKLKSSLFFEGGVGAYNFLQKSYVNPSDTTGSVVQQINNTKAGLNGGIGASLGLTDMLDIMVKSKYHIVFTPNGSSSFVSVGAGFQFRFR